MSRTVIVVGAGMGGLTAALRLARGGYRVRRDRGRRADSAAWRRGSTARASDSTPVRTCSWIGPVWSGRSASSGSTWPSRSRCGGSRTSTRSKRPTGRSCASSADLDETAAGIDRTWPGGGRRYREFVARVSRVPRAAPPLADVVPPRTGRAACAAGRGATCRFLLRSLRSVLASASCRRPSLMPSPSGPMWLARRRPLAPSPLAFVAAILHGVGGFVPLEGMGAMPLALASGRPSRGGRVRSRDQRSRRSAATRDEPRGVTTAEGEVLEADAVRLQPQRRRHLSRAGGRSASRRRARARLEQLPLQSPGRLCLPGRAGRLQPAVPALPPAGRRRAVPSARHAGCRDRRASSATAGCRRG